MSMIKLRQNIMVLSITLVMASSSLFAQDVAKPANPNTSPEAKALLQSLYTLSGKHTMSGVHNFPGARGRNSVFAADYMEKTPIIWGTDFGFAKEGDKDSYLERANMVKQAIEENKKGAIIALCWHAVPPTASEPVTFMPVRGADTTLLASVQGRLSEQQFKDILTKGTALNKKWMAQVDSVAGYLKQLQKAHVPVLWRPYHEMNGTWFWWGGRFEGKYTTKEIYKQIYDRFVNYHKLNNLIWVWSVDRPTKPGMEFANYYPGEQYFDVVSLDVYGSDFKQEYYDQLNTLSKGKLMALAEVGNPPSLDILAKQPKWSYWMIWAGGVRGTTKKQYDIFNSDPRMIGVEDAAYVNAVNPYRLVDGLPPLVAAKPDFAGDWVLNEDKSMLGTGSSANLPAKIKISANGNELAVQKTFIEEWEDSRVTNEKLVLNGQESKSEGARAPMVTVASRSMNGDTILLKSTSTMSFGGRTNTSVTSEKWNLKNHGKVLAITQTADGRGGKRTITMIFDKK